MAIFSLVFCEFFDRTAFLEAFLQKQGYVV